MPMMPPPVMAGVCRSRDEIRDIVRCQVFLRGFSSAALGVGPDFTGLLGSGHSYTHSCTPQTQLVVPTHAPDRGAPSPDSLEGAWRLSAPRGLSSIRGSPWGPMSGATVVRNFARKPFLRCPGCLDVGLTLLAPGPECPDL